ncbi:hypothetical protein PDIDSM_2409 [Penicillium digitatum]|nr:hypothetical protein PDIDSM_2409 [Penicillium digitatum]
MSAETQKSFSLRHYNSVLQYSATSFNFLAQGTRPTPLIQKKHSPAARPQRPYQNHHAIPARNVQQLFDSAAAQQPWPVPPVQTTRTPVAKPQVSQSPSQSHSTSSTQNVLRPSHPNSPPSTQSWTENEICASLVSPKGFKTSAARSKLPQNVITPVTGTREASDFARSNPSLLGSSLHNQHNVPPAVPTAPDKVHSTAISQLVSPRSLSISLASSAPVSASTPPAPPRQTTIVPRQLDKCWSREKVGNQGKAAPDTSYEASNQKGQQPPISQPNGWHSTPVAASAFASLNSAASTSGPAYNSSSNSGPRRGTFSDSPAAQPPVGGNTPSRGYHLPEQLCHQKKRWVPAAEHSDDYSPPIKSLRLDNGRSQMMTHQTYPSTVTSVPGSQVPLDYARHRGPGKILKNRDDLVQPIRRSDALPKQSYDPATIARDVLIAAGRHPTEKHLNHHLEALRRNFTKIDYNADLATFRWDLVDTKQPGTQADRMPPVPASHIPHPQPPHPQPPQAAAWQSLSCDPTFTNSHVASRHHASTPARDTPPNRQVAMPERIDARVPLGGLSPWGTLPFQPPTYHTPQQSLFSNLPSGLPRIDPLSASPKFSSHQSVPFSTPPPAQPQPESQRRRPSTTKSVASPKPSPAKKQTPKFIVKPKPQGQAVKSQLNSGRAVKSPEARRLQPQVVITLSPAKMPTKKRPGRPPKNPANNIEVAIHREQQVQYQVFPCKWEGCAAELHNIDSVKAHLIKVHIPHSLVCKWIDCGNKTPMAAADMFTHLVSEHVSKMAWALGDGPTVPVTAGNKTNHPSVLGDCSARKGTMVLPVDEHQVKAFSKAHGKSTEKTKAQALLEAGRHWKQQVGPEMDWSDRRLSTPVRQSRVHCGEMAFVGEN